MSDRESDDDDPFILSIEDRMPYKQSNNICLKELDKIFPNEDRSKNKATRSSANSVTLPTKKWKQFLMASIKNCKKQLLFECFS